MSLSRKHYEQFAYRIEQIRQDTVVATGSDITRREAKVTRAYLFNLADKLSIDFVLDNPSFDRDRFLKACGF